MNQTLIKALVAAAALAALAVTLYRAQLDAPVPQPVPSSSPLTHDLVLPPPTKTDVAPGLQPLVRSPVNAPGPAGAALMEDVGSAEDPPEEPAEPPAPVVRLAAPEQLFLPSTKAPAFVPAELLSGQEVDAE